MKKGNTKSLLSQWKDERRKNGGPSISKIPAGAPLLASNGQKRLWFLQQLHLANPFYNYSEIYGLTGKLEVEQFTKALQTIIDAHEILRSTYHLENEVIVLKITPISPITIITHDLSDSPRSSADLKLEEIKYSEGSKTFELAEGPLYRIALVKMTKTEHILVLTLHHIVTDKWSMGIFRQQLAKYYRGFCTGTKVMAEIPPIQYGDYSFWQQQIKVPDQQLAYWEKKLSPEIPVLALPKDFRPPSRPSFRGAFCSKSLSKELSLKTLELSSILETTPYTLMLSLFYMLLFRYTDQTDILIGAPISNRDRTELEGLIGFFNDTVVLRTNLKPSMTFKDLVRSVRTTTLEAFANKDVPFDVLVKSIQPERSLGVNPFFQTMFLYHSVPKDPDFGPNLKFSHSVFDHKVSKFDLTLYISEEKGSLTSIFEYATDLFTHSTIERLQAQFDLLLKGVTENPELQISKYPMLSTAEEDIFLPNTETVQKFSRSWNGIHQIIEEVGQKFPDKAAVVFKEDSISYKELNQRAENLAHLILEKIDGPSNVIGICIERSLEMIIGLVAILKAGCAYLPLDPEYPRQRINYMLKDAKVSLILTTGSELSDLTQLTTKTFDITTVEHSVKISNSELPSLQPDALAYIIYTSGSTGNPKGVPITHQNIINSTLARPLFYGGDPESFLLMSSIAFDSSKAGIFWTLCTGGTLVISEKRLEQDMDHLSKIVEKNAVSHTLMLPSLYGLLLNHGDIDKLQGLSGVIVAGEACTERLCKKHFEILPGTELFNEYGPTEASVWCIAHKITRDDLKGPIPIGKPIANTEVYILNDRLEQVPYGAVGELYIGGAGLTNGYLNLPEENQKHFVFWPPNSKTPSRLYRSGDLVRYDKKGVLQFLGRKDQQVKVRGFRIELDEVEKVILGSTLVDRAVVCVEGVQHASDSLETSSLKTQDVFRYIEENLSLSEVDELLKSIEILNEKEQDFLYDKLND